MADEAPIVGLLLTVKFTQPLPNMTVFTMAEIAKLLPDHPIRQQVDRAPAMAVMYPDLTYAEVLSNGPRLRFLTEDLNWELMLQDDRISVGWVRTSPLEEPSGYPGFSKTYEKFQAHVNQIVNFVRLVSGADIVFDIGEVAYADSFYLSNDNGETVRPMQDIFNNIRSLPAFRFSAFNLTFAAIGENDYPSHVETQISGPRSDATGGLHCAMSTTVRFVIGDEDTVDPRFLDAHQAAKEVFATLVKPEAFAISGEQ